MTRKTPIESASDLKLTLLKLQIHCLASEEPELEAACAAMLVLQADALSRREYRLCPPQVGAANQDSA